MKKISVLIGKEKWQEVIGSAISLAKANEALLSLIIMPPQYHLFTMIERESLPLTELQSIIDRQEDEQQEQLAFFQQACDGSGVLHEQWQSSGDHLENVLTESIYSDLLIIAIVEFTSLGQSVPDQPLRRLLSSVKCPLLLLPEFPRTLSRTLLLYDGSPSAVNAFKAFSYLLPALADGPVEVIQVTTDENGMTESKRLTDFVRCHHPDVTYTVLRGHPKEALHNYLAQRHESALLVMGAYGRSRLSRWIRGSMADVLLRVPGYSMFIAH